MIMNNLLEKSWRKGRGVIKGSNQALGLEGLEKTTKVRSRNSLHSSRGSKQVPTE